MPISRQVIRAVGLTLFPEMPRGCHDREEVNEREEPHSYQWWGELVLTLVHSHVLDFVSYYLTFHLMYLNL